MRSSWLYWAAIGVVALFIVGAVVAGGPRSGSTVVTQTFRTGAIPKAAPAASTPGTRRLAVMRVAKEQGLDKGIAVATAVGATDLKIRFERRAAHILERRARRAFDGGRYATAQRVAQTARRRYGTAAASAPAIRAKAAQALAQQDAIIIGQP